VNNPSQGMPDIQASEAQSDIVQQGDPPDLPPHTTLATSHSNFNCRPIKSNRRGIQLLFLN
jgi:hypothetical protein